MSDNSIIFIVDDDNFLLDMYTLKFKENGFNVESARGGEEALEKLREGLSPTIILIDLVMPGVDGFDFLKTVKDEKLAQEAKIIILSNQGQDTEVERAKELGAFDYIIKASAVPSEVLEKVNGYLGKKTEKSDTEEGDKEEEKNEGEDKEEKKD